GSNGNRPPADRKGLCDYSKDASRPRKGGETVKLRFAEMIHKLFYAENIHLLWIKELQEHERELG
ncbi:MAG: hypothetical protein K2N78_04370, partial [Oscillospiraceae bacterium]|nr:hypothetical protein [Oscillospiraceae bacterium]